VLKWLNEVPVRSPAAPHPRRLRGHRDDALPPPHDRGGDPGGHRGSAGAGRHPALCGRGGYPGRRDHRRRHQRQPLAADGVRHERPRPRLRSVLWRPDLGQRLHGHPPRPVDGLGRGHLAAERRAPDGAGQPRHVRRRQRPDPVVQPVLLAPHGQHAHHQRHHRLPQRRVAAEPELARRRASVELGFRARLRLLAPPDPVQSARSDRRVGGRLLAVDGAERGHGLLLRALASLPARPDRRRRRHVGGHHRDRGRLAGVRADPALPADPRLPAGGGGRDRGDGHLLRRHGWRRELGRRDGQLRLRTGRC